MFVVVVGCGRVGSRVAKNLVDDGHDVNVIDENPESFVRLGDDFPGQFIEGQAIEMSVLRAAGLERADAFVAATNGDNTNIVVAQIARARFSVPCVVARVLDPNRARFYAERGLTTICPTQSAVAMITDAVREQSPAPDDGR